MSAEIIMFVPKTNPNRQHDLERQAIEIANVAFPSVLESPYNGSGIDGMNLDTDKDSA
jgi:hypothetical protein